MGARTEKKSQKNDVMRCSRRKKYSFVKDFPLTEKQPERYGDLIIQKARLRSLLWSR